MPMPMPSFRTSYNYTSNTCRCASLRLPFHHPFLDFHSPCGFLLQRHQIAGYGFVFQRAKDLSNAPTRKSDDPRWSLSASQDCWCPNSPPFLSSTTSARTHAYCVTYSASWTKYRTIVSSHRSTRRCTSANLGAASNPASYVLIIRWSQWVANCTKTFPPSLFPNPVPSQIHVPQWVLLGVTNENLVTVSHPIDSPELGPGSGSRPIPHAFPQ
ncbi:hypothetical protein V8E52_004379 [Russula decolorans]